MPSTVSPESANDGSPPHAGVILIALILVATVANLNLSVANVALPDIGLAFKASQSALNLVAVGFSLGLAGTVLYLGAIGDRYGRSMMLLIGTALAIPTSIAAAWSGDMTMLIVSRVLGGVAAGMAFPTTLALITALWSGPARVRAIAAPISARLIERFGSRITLLCGYAFCLASFVMMLVTWTETSSYGVVALAFCLAGIGVGLAGTPASHSLTSSVPVRRAGMASGTSDLQRDLGGSIMQSLLGAILTAGYASAVAAAVAKSPTKISDAVTSELQRSFASAATVAQRYPAYTKTIIAGARASFLQGANWAYASGCVSIILGAIVIAMFFPRHGEERRLLTTYQRQDSSSD